MINEKAKDLLGNPDVTIHKTDLQRLVDRMTEQIQRNQLINRTDAEQYFAQHKQLGNCDV